MNKTVYICGDSFAVPDLEFGKCWVDLLSAHLTVVNLSVVCASNLLIAKQVDQAITEKANFIICLGTSSVRLETNLNNTVIPFSINSIDNTTPFNEHQQTILKQYITEFFNLDIAIYKNQCIIESTLQKLKDSKIPFLFDRGGFEHSSFRGSNKLYFQKYQTCISKINLWDYAPSRTYRPHYHITDSAVHEMVFQYYYKIINDKT